MTLQDVALMPKIGVELTVFGYDTTLDGGKRVGGDHIVVTGGAGPNSPLVVYGDTSQDGIWYSGHADDVRVVHRRAESAETRGRFPAKWG